MAEPQPFRFLDLSAELRNQVYDLVLKDYELRHGRSMKILKNRRSGKLFTSSPAGSPYANVAFLRTNRQIYSEATPVLYRNKITCAEDAVVSIFLKQIGGSISLLRHLKLDWCGKSLIRHTLVLLKQATHLDHFEIGHQSTEYFGDTARMVKEIGPWFRAFHKMRKANTVDNHDSAVDVLSFTPVFYGWEGKSELDTRAAKAAEYSAAVKAALLKTLKD